MQFEAATKKKKRHEESTGRGDRSGRTRNVDDQNTSEIRRRTRKKIRYHREGTSRKSTSVTTLTDALGKTRMECNKVLVKANIAIEDSNRAANALVKHLAALDEEIEAFENIVSNSESAASYLETQVKRIAEYIAKLTNVPSSEMEAMRKILAE